MDLGKKVQEAKRKARGFFAFRDKKGNLVGEMTNLGPNDQLHPSEAIGNDLVKKGVIMSYEKNITAGQLSFNNFMVDELANDINAQRGTEINR